MRTTPPRPRATIAGRSARARRSGARQLTSSIACDVVRVEVEEGRDGPERGVVDEQADLAIRRSAGCSVVDEVGRARSSVTGGPCTPCALRCSRAVASSAPPSRSIRSGRDRGRRAAAPTPRRARRRRRRPAPRVRTGRGSRPPSRCRVPARRGTPARVQASDRSGPVARARSASAGIDADRFADVLEAERPGPVRARDVGRARSSSRRSLRADDTGRSTVRRSLHVVDDGLEHRHHQPALRQRQRGPLPPRGADRAASCGSRCGPPVLVATAPAAAAPPPPPPRRPPPPSRHPPPPRRNRRRHRRPRARGPRSR